MTEFEKWLVNERKIRELQYCIIPALRKLKSQFSYLRLEALVFLLGLTKSLSNEEDIARFVSLQKHQNLNVTRHALQYILSPSTAANNNNSSSSNAANATNATATVTKISSVSNLERQRALELLQGVCLYDKASRLVFREWGGMELMLKALDSQYPAIQIAVMNVLLSVLLDSRENQELFKRLSGFAKLKKMIENKDAAKELRIKAVEFIYLVSEYYDEYASDVLNASGASLATTVIVDYTKPIPKENSNKQALISLFGAKQLDTLFKSIQWEKAANEKMMSLYLDDVQLPSD